MRCIAIAILLSLSTTAATAQISACRAVKQGEARLDCYDKLFPPPKVSADGKPVKSTSYDEESLKEEARMKKLLRPICKDCAPGR
ncbi:MAG: hypothetical protein HXX15_22305 [Rhodopseudomonas sp.]|uniref:hypothetical protein n=1 Tax=Rhodopseudomonas sp. TaxID=1078 RepID=UPI0017A55C10|nr:hypothetical protein [Rhodopseudomonas sp.]NVN88818.1 hypothetical protein [Rhodopseudomonas sp.]